MENLQLFNVSPSIPSELSFLEDLARNMWWCWNDSAIELFRRINPPLWNEAGHNPLKFLTLIPQERFEALTRDEGFLSHLRLVRKRFRSSLLATGGGQAEIRPSGCIAYFSLEFGIHESIRVYSGGLGVLAGDHLKAASDLHLPLVAVGLLYRQGYFQQHLDGEGWQLEHYPENEINFMPVQKAVDSEGRQIEISLNLPEGPLRVVIWQLNMGRVPLYLLDTNIPENPPELRTVTAQLYGGDRATRLRQELVLGIGGYRALLALGHNPAVCHMNEGHAAFLSVGRIEHMMKSHGYDFDTAAELVTRTNVFTTHTPVSAGNEMFGVDLLRPYLEALSREVGVPAAKLMQMGFAPDQPTGPEFSMTVLGMRMAYACNGVSRLHGVVARKMWQHLWPDRPVDEVPVTHVTNGIHVSTWLSPNNAALYDRYLGPEWQRDPGSPRVLEQVELIPDEELWHVHELGRSRLIRKGRELLEQQLRLRNAPRAQVAQAKFALEHDVLTIGFARRFATYKRGTLLLKDPERFEALLTNEERPVQIVFAGKAHPADNPAKELIRELIRFTRRYKAQGRVIFLENYDIMVARTLVQGVDVWLNTPRRPQEASGTSGMKAAVNGGINVSVLDGWWCEGYSKDCGWAVGSGEEYDESEYQDQVESQALYNLLEDEIVPCFYDRSAGAIPRRWISMMKGSIRMGLGYFTSQRMVAEYYQRFYGPALREHESLTNDKASRARKLVAQHKRLDELWSDVSLDAPVAEMPGGMLHLGDKINVTCTVYLGDLTPDEADVQVYYGPVDSYNEITESHIESMKMLEEKGEGTYVYQQVITCRRTGRYGFTTRATPSGTDWVSAMPGYLTWAD
ncbi:MAG: alpha-glucan phosphorylase [Lentisphaerae bacterium RIFOXYB12_FULL_65_16]|nr:MAG: alpha-glucan phosphorylase [Lentisphaerae bacterium RIFOXYA12_64_32]OGV91007.1 MAG: alpha-glucan phosphorylase [Lentisphaerae bacterium RIFOXYB12_FULL_65_16]